MHIDLFDVCGTADNLPAWYKWRVRTVTYYAEGLISQGDYDLLNALLQERLEELIYSGGCFAEVWEREVTYAQLERAEVVL